MALRKLNELDEYINNLDLNYIPEAKAVVTKLVDYIEITSTSKEHIEGFKKLMDQCVEIEKIVPEVIADNIKNNNNDLFGKYKENKFIKLITELDRDNYKKDIK